MKVIGLDLSFSDTGIYYENSGTSVTTTNDLDPDTNINRTKRIDFITTKLLDIVTKFDESVLVVIEGYAMGYAGSKNTSSGRLFDLGELGGVTKYLLYKKNIKYVVVTPGQLKKFATGIGKGTKSDVRMAVYKYWNIDIANDNVCDAFVLYKIGCALVNDVRLTSYQAEIVKKLKDQL